MIQIGRTNGTYTLYRPIGLAPNGCPTKVTLPNATLGRESVWARWVLRPSFAQSVCVCVINNNNNNSNNNNNNNKKERRKEERTDGEIRFGCST